MLLDLVVSKGCWSIVGYFVLFDSWQLEGPMHAFWRFLWWVGYCINHSLASRVLVISEIQPINPQTAQLGHVFDSIQNFSAVVSLQISGIELFFFKCNQCNFNAINMHAHLRKWFRINSRQRGILNKDKTKFSSLSLPSW